MKRFAILLIFNCFIFQGYNQTKTSNLPATHQPFEISFNDADIVAPDLHIKRLTALPVNDSVLFTLIYSSKKDRYLSFFNPPRGSVIMYRDRKGIKKDDTVTTFRIAKNIFKSMDQITMRFSVSNKFERDGNFIFLSSNRDFLETHPINVSGTQTNPIGINFTITTSASDLQIKWLTAVLENDQVKFTLAYRSQKDRSLQLFASPNGEKFYYVDYNGLKKGDTITSFHIAKNKFRSVNDLQMRFSTNQNAGNDRNYIYLDLSDPSVKDLLGLPRGTFAKKKSINLFARTFVAPVSTIKLFIALCFLIPLLIYVGNKANSYTSVIEKMITNRWLMFNVKAFILNNIIILCILLFTGCFNEPIPASLYFSLLIIATFPANLVYLVENVFLKKRNLFWLRQYLSIVSIIVGLYFTYFLFYNVTDGMLSKKGIYIEYVILSGILVEFMRLINNYISYQKLVSLREKEFEILRLNELKTRSDLNALQSKINPHFLYNALNSIAELCWKDAQKTERMALSLSKLFRYSINKEENDFSSLKKEIELVSLYLSIEKERFGDHLNYQFEYSKDIEDILIPKFILQPLIENAIKHGIAKMPNGGFVKLTIKKIKNETEIKAYDNGPDFPVNWISGYGLKSIYDKLDILYPKRYAIELYNGTEKNITVILKDDV